MRVTNRLRNLMLPLRGRRRKVVVEDLRNILRYGIHAPRLHMQIYVVPQEITQVIDDPVFNERRMVRIRNVIIDGNWDGAPTALRNARYCNVRKIYESVSSRIRSGVAWEQTPAYDRMLSRIERYGGEYDKCRNLQDVIARYHRLDALIDEVRDSGRMKSIREVHPVGFREVEGIHVAVTRS